MNKPFTSDRFVVPAVAVLAIALFALAILQYRWTTQVGEVTGLRIGTNLKTMMTGWHLDFFRQIADLPIRLQVGPDAGAHDTWDVYLQRYSIWNTKMSEPNPAQELLLWETSTSEGPRLLRFNLEARRLDPMPVPDDLQKLLIHLQASSKDMSTAVRAWLPPDGSESAPLPTAPAGPDVATTGWQFDPRVPAAVHPIVHHRLPGDSAPVRSGAVDWIVVVYNWSMIETELIPRLAERYFGNPEGLEFQVAVVTAVNGAPQQLIYSSDPGFGRGKPPDAILNIFGPAPENIESRVWQPSEKNANSATEWKRISGFLWFPVIQYAGSKPTWELRVRHRRDSLTSVIDGVRRRNLILGLGVLAVLAGSIVMLLIASYRAQTLSKLQMQFVASVSHELRTPLAVLSSATENIADGVVQDPERLRQYRSMMRKQIRQLTELVDHVLLFAASHQSSPVQVLRPVSLSDVVRSVMDDLLGLIQQNGVTVECSIAEDFPQVLADATVLSQCLQTLVVNAIKYRGQSRVVRIEAEFNSQQGHREARLTVRDRGLGIPESELPHIFKPFYRGASVTAANIHGSGLGLALAKSLVEAIGGRITVASEYGKGSAFTIHLQPVSASNPQPAGAATAMRS